MVTLGKANQLIYERLETKYGKNEIRQFSYLIFEHLLQLPPVDIHTKPETEIGTTVFNQLTQIIEELLNDRPVQYILGFSRFYDCKIKVTPNVLIPRPETEELVDWIVKDYAQQNRTLRILDIGTGSGCIAIALKKQFADATVEAIDFVEEALDVARKNAQMNDTEIDFYEADILHWTDQSALSKKKYDIIVSNPPYICEKEKEVMKPNVLQHEPPEALFVADENPLIFYKAIYEFALQGLASKGKLYVEINQNLPQATVELFHSGFDNVNLRKDLNGHFRMIRAAKRQ